MNSRHNTIHFAIDIDGCITKGKGKFTSTKDFTKLQEYIFDNDMSVFLCTGRSAPYVEAIAQLLHVNQWCICENGAYIYNPMTDEIQYNPLITDKTLNAISEFKTLIETPKYKSICTIELGKDVCISLNPTQGTIEALYTSLYDTINHDLLYINHSTTAVDITPKGIDKGSALRFLCQIQKWDLADIVAIGDTSGDIPFMQISGKKACPANASEAVHTIADYVSEMESTEGVLDILEYFKRVPSLDKS